MASRQVGVRRWSVSLLLVACALFSSGCISSIIESLTGEDEASAIRAVGVPTEATILDIWETGMRINDNPVVGFRLEVHPPDGAPYEAETTALVSILDIPQIQPGKTLTVLVDPQDPQRVAFPVGE